jgi:phenylpyruvate tautomerase PptA (4-oxalocrotonate tautomerase family)
MPNIWVTGLDREQTREFSRRASELFERELGTPRQSVYVYLREAVLFRDGEPAEMPAILQVSWIKRPREHFDKLVAGLTRIVKQDLGRRGSVQVELVEKWDDATIDGETCAAWAARNRK